MPKLLITGATGRLGGYIVPELQKFFDVTAVGIENWDFTYPILKGKYDLILHMGAYTDVKKAQVEADKCFQANAFGTFNLVNLYKDIPFIYISTEYANKPLGIYALTKRLGEEIVKSHPQHLIIRTSFKPTPFPFPYAYSDQYTQGDYVDVIAKVLVEEINKWDGMSQMIYAGTGRKTMFELAQRTRPDVLPNKVDDYNKVLGIELVPYDYE